MIALPLGLTHARDESFPSRTSSTLLILFLVYARPDRTRMISIHLELRTQTNKEILEQTRESSIGVLLQIICNVRKLKRKWMVYTCVLYVHITCECVPCLLFRTGARSGWGIKIDSDWQPSNKWSFESISQEYLHQVHSGFIFWICCLSLWHQSAGLLIVLTLFLRIKNVKQAII